MSATESKGPAAGVCGPDTFPASSLTRTLHAVAGRVVRACLQVLERSLNRLGMDCLDLVQFHW